MGTRKFFCKRFRALTVHCFTTSSFRALWLLIAVLFLYAPACYASDPWRIDDLEVLVDQTGHESIESISRPERSADFQPVPEGFSAGYTRAVHWLRFTLHAPPPDARGSREMLLEFQPPYVDDLRIYLSQSQALGQFDVRYGGDRYPQTSKEIPYRAFIYRVFFEDDRSRRVYVRLQTTSSSVLIVNALEPRQLAKKISQEYLFFGLLLGLILIGLLVNVWNGLWRTEPTYRWYIAYLTATLFNLIGINGLAGNLLLPEMPFWANHWTSLSVIGVVLFGIRFYMLALDIEHAAPWMRWAYRLQLWAAICCLPAPFLDFYPEAVQVLLLSLLLIMLVGTLRSVQLWKQHNPNGKILLLAHLFSLSGNLSAIPALLGLLPGQLWLIYGFQLRSVSTLLVLQWMLAKHMRVMRAKLIETNVHFDIAKTIAQQERVEREHQRHFLSMLTHELKTPLSVIRMRLGAITPSARMQAHATQAVEDIDAIVERCSLVSQIDEKAGTLQFSRCHIAEILSEIVTQQPATKRIEVQVLDNVVNTPLQSDPLLLRTILSNLIDNAAKYSPRESTVKLSVSLSSQAQRNGMRIQVENDVANTAMPDPARVFEKYYRAPSAYQQSGSGLGLYIVKALSLQLGGTMNYRALTNQVTFDLWLPL